jgi:hypothetical protein
MNAVSLIFDEYMPGPQSEVLLNLVREEMRRYEGKKWKTVAFRVRYIILVDMTTD